MAAQLNPRQQRFVAEYLIDLNATQAAIRAGYSAKTAQPASARLLSHVIVEAAIAKGRAKQELRAEVRGDDVIRELVKIGFANMADYVRITPSGDPAVDLGNLTRDQFAAVGEITIEDFTDSRGEDKRDVRRVKFKLADKRGALVDLGRHFALFTDKVESRVTTAALSDGELDDRIEELQREVTASQPTH